jgi:hypothetical protein
MDINVGSYECVCPEGFKVEPNQLNCVGVCFEPNVVFALCIWENRRGLNNT